MRLPFQKTLAEKHAKAYQYYRDRGMLHQNLWRSENSACALGAYFGARDSGEAKDKCIEQGLPPWLIYSTPGIFDGLRLKDAIPWADALFGVNGIILKIDKLPKALQQEVWHKAYKKIECYMHHHPVDYPRNSCGYWSLSDWVNLHNNRAAAAGSIVVAIEDAYDELIRTLAQ